MTTHPRRLVICGAGGRDFHDFATAYRDDAAVEVVAFTATQIPGIDHRTFPAALAGPRYPDGIPIVPEAGLSELVRRERVDEVVLAYSDLPHAHVLHVASIAMAAGADFTLLGPRRTMLRARRPVVAVCATRTGAGKSPVTRRIGRLLLDAGLRVALVRHPMPYGDLVAERVQRFATLDDIDAAGCTIEEREEYEAPVRLGMLMYAGVDYEAIIEAAADESDVIVWDGGNNDFPFVQPDLWITVADALRPADGLGYHPGEVNLRSADVVVINKVDVATREQVEEVAAQVAAVNAHATVVRTASPVTFEPGPSLDLARVVVVEDGPTLTHGGMAVGAGIIAARAAGAVIVDPRPYAVGSIAETYRKYPHLGAVLPAMGYSEEQLADLAATINATPCDVVVTGTPIDLGRLVPLGAPVRHVAYEVAEVGSPTLADVLAPFIDKARAAST